MFVTKSMELREKRAKAWDSAKAFLEGKRGDGGVLSAEDAAVYERMEAEVVALGKEIDRLDRQAALDRELDRPANAPLANKPGAGLGGEDKAGRATAVYKRAFWNALRNKTQPPDVTNALQVGSDVEGGYLAPDEFEHTLIEALHSVYTRCMV
jgi:HK97 family phage major capsid protein